MKSTLTFLFLLATVLSFSQIRINSESQENIDRIVFQSKEKTNIQIKKGNPLLPIYKVHGELCLSTIGKVTNSFSVNNLNDKAFIGSQVGNIVTIKIPLKNLAEINNFQNVLQIQVAERIYSHNNKMTSDLRADSVWAGTGLAQAFTGKNVLIGITDWGFDYDHPMFMDTTLTTSRVRAAWDHFKHSGNQPAGFGYGVEYVTPVELDSANSDTAGDYYDYATHGNHVAGIAGAVGNNGIGIAGAAWDVKLMSVKVFQANGYASMTDIVEGINYASENGATIMNMSFSSQSSPLTLYNALATAYTNMFKHLKYMYMSTMHT